MVTTPEPAGFPNCGVCPFRESGTATICFECASKTLPQEGGSTCPVCGLAMQPRANCGNPICSWEDRGFGRVHVIAMHRAHLRDVISRFKHDRRTAWAAIFGRIVVGYLEAHRDAMRGYDLIVPNPTFPEPTKIQHTELTIEAARIEDDWYVWPFDEAPWALTKTHATPSSTGGTWHQKNDRAQQHADAIEIDVARIRGKRILLYDDVFTTGAQYHWVGRKLREAGATHVDGLVLARRGWGG